MSVLRLLRNGLRLWRAQGTRALWRELQRRLSSPQTFGSAPVPVALPPPPPPPRPLRPAQAQSAQALLQARLPAYAPLPVFPIPAAARPRISLVVDRLARERLGDGGGTALVVAQLLAQRRGASLRIVTRSEPAQPASAQMLAEAHGLMLPDDVEFALAPIGPTHASVSVHPDELFVTASSACAAAALAVVPPQRLLHLVLDDEPARLAAGDERLRCEQVLATPGLCLATPALAPPMPGARTFEVAFPDTLYARQATAGSDGRRRLALVASPDEGSTLFHRGLELIERGLSDGVIDAQRWSLHLVGHGLPSIRLSDGCVPDLHEPSTLAEWAGCLGSMHAAVALHQGGHAHGALAEIAACGVPLLCNHGPGQHLLARQCSTVMTCATDLPAMLDGLARLLAAAAEDPPSAARLPGLPRDWSSALAPFAAGLGNRVDAWA